MKEGSPHSARLKAVLLLVPLLAVLLGGSLAFGGTPHVVYAKVLLEDGITPPGEGDAILSKAFPDKWWKGD